jgi:hypothetical protein
MGAGCSAAGGSGQAGDEESVDSAKAAVVMPAPPAEIQRYFDGVDDRVVVPHRAEYDFGTGDFTLAVTAKVTNASGSVVPLLSKRQSFDGYYFIIYNNQLLLQIRGNNSLSGQIPELRDGKLHHLAVTRKGSALTFYVDGVAKGTGANAGDASGPLDLVIGYDGTDRRALRGQIKSVGLWNAALTNDEIAFTAAGHKLNGESNKGLWNLAYVARDLVIDESPVGNFGYLGTERNDWDARDADLLPKQPVVGPPSDAMPARLSALGEGSDTPLGADSCGDVLVNGTFDVLLTSSQRAFESKVRNYMCQKYEDVASKKGSVGLTIPIGDVPVNLTASSEDAQTFRNEWCRDDSSEFKYQEAYTIAQQIASQTIVDAWLACMGLKQQSEIVWGDSQSSADGKVLTLTAYRDTKIDEQKPTTVYAFTISGATCSPTFTTGQPIPETGVPAFCTRTGSGPVLATLSTNHGVVVWSFESLLSADAWVTGSQKVWESQGNQCRGEWTESKYNCPAIRFPRKDCEERNGRTYTRSWDTAADERASHATLVVTSDSSFTKDYGTGPTGTVTDTHVWGALRVYKQTEVTWKLCADIEKQVPKLFTSATKKIDGTYPFNVELPVAIESPVLHVRYAGGTERVIDLANSSALATVSKVTDGVKNYWNVTLN